MRAFGLLILSLAGICAAYVSPEVHSPRHLAPSSDDSLSKRASNTTGAFQIPIYSPSYGGACYRVNDSVAIGTPPQKGLFCLDIGTSTTWTYLLDSNDDGPDFKISKSTTYRPGTKHALNVTYPEGYAGVGDSFYDTLTVSSSSQNITLLNQQLGLVNSTSYYEIKGHSPTYALPESSILGLGLPSSSNSSSSSSSSSLSTSPGFLGLLKSEGHIPAAAFSLFLGDESAVNGSILFGGVDADKFVGPIQILPLLPAPAHPSISDPISSSLRVHLSGFSIDGIPNIPSLNGTAVIDTTVQSCVLPASITGPILSHLGAVHNKNAERRPVVNCALKTSNITINFQFGNSSTAYKVPIREFFSPPMPDEDPDYPVDNLTPAQQQDVDNWKGACYLKVLDNSDGGKGDFDFFTLGTSFLRSTYFIFDHENKEVGLAQANPNATTSNVVEFSSNGGGIKALNVTAANRTEEGSSAAVRFDASSSGATVAAVAGMVAFLLATY